MAFDPLIKDERNPFDRNDYTEAMAHLAHRLSCIVHDKCKNVPHDIGLLLMDEMLKQCTGLFGFSPREKR